MVMKEIRIDVTSENQRFDKFLKKYFKEASMGFLYKMLRKKNITLNGKKASGNEILKNNDVISVFFSDETFQKMKGSSLKENSIFIPKDLKERFHLIYEDENILAVNKPKNMLSQKAVPKDISLNEYLLAYLFQKGEIDEESLRIYRPSVMNRLDRNTTGVVLCAKTLKGAQFLSEALKQKETPKIYHCFCKGVIDKEMLLKDYLLKDESKNTVSVVSHQVEGAKEIITGVKPLEVFKDYTYVEVELFTGRTHQIRAHLSSIGHPILGDAKYGDLKLNDVLQKKYHVKSQMLHAYSIHLDGIKEITALDPKEFQIFRKALD